VTVNTSPPLIMPFTLGTGAGAVMGQGTKPETQVLVSFSDTAIDPPVWSDVTARVRSFSTSRGRNSELSEHDAGTATVMLDNRDRAFDPTYSGSPYYPNVRPMNRVWIREMFNGVTNSVFKGYVEAYDQQWPDGGFSDAITVVAAADEFKVLTKAGLPVTEPPRDTYADVVQADFPTGYWRCKDQPSSNLLAGTVGPPLTPIPGSLKLLHATRHSGRV
jgi:hypothetical protein